jgi:V8-like Glu-specific endopeptidase
MRLTGEQSRRLTDAMVKALRKKTVVERVVRFGLNEDLDAIVGGDNLTDVVFDLVRWAESQERLEELIVEARRENHGNSLLKAVSEEVFSSLLDVSREGLEAIVSVSGFSDIEPWLERMWQCSYAVCCIEINGFARGTGFLLDANHVITNYHVMEEVIDNPALQNMVVLRFHYKVDADGRRLSTGVECYLAEGKWLCARSPIRRLDYALLRIDTSNVQQYGNIPLVWQMPQSHTFTVGEPLCIIQHPKGNPQKIALGSVTRHDAQQGRVYYTVNTSEGSSGAPCVSSNGKIVALHQRESDGVSNKGIPFAAILADL